MPRTEIRNMQHMAQVCDFTGMRFGSILPTDIDGFIDFGNKLFVIIEAKYQGAEPPFGQRLALERLADAVGTNVETFLLLVTHENQDHDPIALGSTIVRSYRYRGEWHVPKNEMTCMEAVSLLVERYAPAYSQHGGVF